MRWLLVIGDWRTANSEQRTANSEQRTANSEQRTVEEEKPSDAEGFLFLWCGRLNRKELGLVGLYGVEEGAEIGSAIGW